MYPACLRPGVILLLCFCSLRLAGSPLPRSTPEEEGVSSAGVLAFVQAAEEKLDALHSVMIVRHGHVVAEGWWAPYSAESPHELYSLSKSFTSTAIGLLVAEGRLRITDPVLSFFPELAPAEPGDNLKNMRVRDLLIMSTGHETEPPIWASEDPWAKNFLKHPVPHQPGTHFKYNTPATYLLSAIVQKLTGQTLPEYLQPRLFDPLGIEKPTWETNREGISTGGWGLSIRTEDITKFGLLNLQAGRWHGRQLIPSAWIEAASARQTSNGSDPDSDWQQGYGYQFWRCRPAQAYRGDGAFGQFCIVLPEQDAVIAITGGVRDMQAVMNLVWTQLLPAMQPAPLPADLTAQKSLAARLAGLTLPAQAGAAVSPRATEFAGRSYAFPDNDRKLAMLSYTLAADGTPTFRLRHADRDQFITSRPGVWTKTRLAYDGRPERPVAVSGAWTADDTYTLKLCAYETPYITTIRLQFSGEEVRYDAEVNVAFGPRQSPQLVGTSTPPAP